MLGVPTHKNTYPLPRVCRVYPRVPLIWSMIGGGTYGDTLPTRDRVGRRDTPGSARIRLQGRGLVLQVTFSMILTIEAA